MNRPYKFYQPHEIEFILQAFLCVLEYGRVFEMPAEEVPFPFLKKAGSSKFTIKIRRGRMWVGSEVKSVLLLKTFLESHSGWCMEVSKWTGEQMQSIADEINAKLNGDMKV